MKFILNMRVKLLIAVLFCAALFFIAHNSRPSARYSKEQIARQNVLTLVRLIRYGNFEMPVLKDALALIREQVDTVRKECAGNAKPCPDPYKSMDDAFFNAVAGSYEFKADNSFLLNSLYMGFPGGGKAGQSRHPWLDIRKDLLDRLENEVNVSCDPSGIGRAGLREAEIFAATDIQRLVNSVEKNIARAIKKQAGISSSSYRFVHNGSTSRGVSLDNADFDFALLFEKREDFSRFMERLGPVLGDLSAALSRNGYSVLINSQRQIHERKLLNFIIRDQQGIVFRLQVIVNMRVGLYLDNLDRQIRQIEALGVSWDDFKGQIILFKKLLKSVFHVYGSNCASLDGMECEQLIIQAQSSKDYGRMITGVGSFGKLMYYLNEIGFDRSSSRIIPFENVSSKLKIYYLDQDTKQDKTVVFSDILWRKLVNAARKFTALGDEEMSENDFAGLNYTLADAACYREGANYAVEVWDRRSFSDFKKFVMSDIAFVAKKYVFRPVGVEDVEMASKGRYFVFFKTVDAKRLSAKLAKFGLLIVGEYGKD